MQGIRMVGRFQKQKGNLKNQVAEFMDAITMHLPQKHHLRRLQCSYQCIAATRLVTSYGQLTQLHHNKLRHVHRLLKKFVDSFLELVKNLH